MSRKVSDTLIAAVELLSQPGAHTTSTLARDSGQYRCKPTDPAACSWCLLGAIAKVENISAPEEESVHEALEDTPAFRALESGLSELHGYRRSVTSYNDRVPRNVDASEHLSDVRQTVRNIATKLQERGL